ncbi:phage baseplate assembly protein V [Undibacterium rugosum]|uniref:phage baseplate assembly protein V n=1 Tax=Undibacterium rugosum TaxID=2762291 RepID=UPI001B827495|nr:phage baseplate assembly protein V [Undibacterium rugosum]MBR7777371.1 phage baseplate assembly protein V [Undibacterium rugosum]
MEFNLADLSRRLENMIRLGTIAEVKHSRTPQVRVQLGDITTNWLPVTTPHAGNKKTWCPPSVGEQCIVFSPSGDIGAGIVLPGVNSKHYPAPDDDKNNTRTVYPDGAVIEYNHETHALVVTLPAGATAVVTAPTSVIVKSDAITLDAPKTTCTGNLLVEKTLTYMGGMQGYGIAADAGSSAAVIHGSVHASEDITAGNISLQNHVHREQGDGQIVSKPQ